MEKRAKGHMDLIFPVVLFLVFTLTALFVILYAARTYQNIIYDSNKEYEASTSLAYISRKIHSSDTNGSVSVGKYLGHDAITIKQEINGDPYITYIYAYDGSLRELFCADNGQNLGENAGSILFNADEFVAQMVGPNLIKMTIQQDSDMGVQYISILSGEGGH